MSTQICGNLEWINNQCLQSSQSLSLHTSMAQPFSLFSSMFLVLLTLQTFVSHSVISAHGFSIKEATVDDIRLAFKQNKLTSRNLVEFYLKRIRKFNPVLHGVIEVNPDALYQADKADQERKTAKAQGRTLTKLHGIPILLKDNIATKDELNTTAGSFALLGSVVPQDATVVTKLRKVGAIILGKATLTEWSAFRSDSVPNGWSARGGQGQNPYNFSVTACGSSSGSGISVSSNMVAVAVGTDTDGSILCPSSFNGVVGIRPTVGLTSRAGVVPISPRQDTVGPLCRTVSDAVYVLDAIVGNDNLDGASKLASKYIPKGGYSQFLKADGLKGKRLGIVRDPLFNFSGNLLLTKTYKNHFEILRQQGAILVDNLKFANIDVVLDWDASGERTAMQAEFKTSLNAYLKDLEASPVRSLADAIAFNTNHSKLEKIKEYKQNLFLEANKTNGIRSEKAALLKLEKLTKTGFEKLMVENELDAFLSHSAHATSVLAIGGFPGISVPAGFYSPEGVPFGICFGGLKGSEPKLIQIAYSFEQATKIRKPPPNF